MLTSYWPVPLATHLCPDAANINPVLARVFRAMRATEALNNPDAQADTQGFYASNDQLLKRIDLPEFKQLIQFFARALQTTVSAVNKDTWPKEKISLQLEILGCWFQIQNGMAFHDIHTHGNCSWSGVYYVQIDRTEKRIGHPAMGEQNGVTRFYGPYSQWQAGAHMDVGNAYLQKNTIDIEPEEGKLVLFPAYLPHKAMPYEGDLDRIIVSFNAQLHAAQGDQLFDFSAR
jgi:uncharacterized protein (TIGR02466 family)